MTDGCYEAALAHPAGASTVARLARTTADHGYEGLVVRNADVAGDADRLTDADAERIAGEYGVDVVPGVEIDADDPESAAGHLGAVRSKTDTEYTVVAVAGGTEAMNRFAAGQDRVDVLARPLRGPAEVDHVVADEAREHGVRVEFDLSPALRVTGGNRVRALADLRRLREIVEDRDAPFVVSARPDSHLGVRAPRELLAVSEAVGFERETVRAGLREWGRLAARNRERAADAFVEPGVWRGRYEDRPSGDRSSGDGSR